MTDYFQTLDCSGTGTPTFVRSPSVVETVTGTGTPSFIKTISRIRSVSGASVPVLRKIPLKSLSAVGASVATKRVLVSRTYAVVGGNTPRVIRTLLKSLICTASKSLVLGTERQGADSFSVARAYNRWTINTPDMNRWDLLIVPRFSISTLGD